MENLNSIPSTINNAIEESSTGYLLEQVYTSLAQDLPLQTINTAMLSTYANPQNIDRMVQLEMERIKENWARSEEQYVEQQLLENPITIERRPSAHRHHLQTPQSPQQQQPYHPAEADLTSQSLYQPLFPSNSTGAAVLRDTNALLPLEQHRQRQQQQQQLEIQQQRAEACRRSRYNNKIKKAKSKFRHKFMSQKLLQSTQMFDCIQDLIVQAESHLLAQGLTKDKLQQLRVRYGMDRLKAPQ